MKEKESPFQFFLQLVVSGKIAKQKESEMGMVPPLPIFRKKVQPKSEHPSLFDKYPRRDVYCCCEACMHFKLDQPYLHVNPYGILRVLTSTD